MFFLFSCTPKPQDIEYYSDECAACKMKISDPNFGAELVTKKGKVYKYDSAECMVNSYLETGTDQFKWVLVTDYTNPRTLIDARESTYLISENLPSPMGGNLSAFRKTDDALFFKMEKGGEILSFDELVHLYKLK